MGFIYITRQPPWPSRSVTEQICRAAHLLPRAVAHVSCASLIGPPQRVTWYVLKWLLQISPLFQYCRPDNCSLHYIKRGSGTFNSLKCPSFATTGLLTVSRVRPPTIVPSCRPSPPDVSAAPVWARGIACRHHGSP